jgi:hypothetical protein
VAFDLESYKRIAGRLDDGDIDYAAFRRDPLPDDVLRCVRYMHDVESHTSCYLRNLLNTRAHHDPAITEFMTMWAFEEQWHGEALGRVLAAHGEAAGAARIEPMRSAMGWRSSVAPLGWMAFSAMTRHFVAIHMTFGVVNEWTTQGGYSRLLSRADHPVLTDLLRRIMRQEGRHIDYYRSEATDRLAASPGARRVVRGALRHLWSPVGSKVMPRAETRHLVTTLFDGDDGAAVAARIDRRIDALPGLAGLDLMRGVLRDHGLAGRYSTVMAYSGQLSAARRAASSSSAGTSALHSRTA